VSGRTPAQPLTARPHEQPAIRPTRLSRNPQSRPTYARSVQATDATTPDPTFAETFVVHRTIQELERRLTEVMQSDTDHLPTVMLAAQRATGTPEAAETATATEAEAEAEAEAESSAQAERREGAGDASDNEREAGSSIAPRNSHAGSRPSPRGTA
jgi:hypothetical protein